MTTTHQPLPPGFFRIRLELARERAHPEGARDIGYRFVAPLDPQGRLEPAQWREHKHLCRAVRFRPDEDQEIGHFVRRPGGSWAFRYDLIGEDKDEGGRQFEAHAFKVGEYVSVAEDDGVHTYRVASVTPAEGEGV